MSRITQNAPYVFAVDRLGAEYPRLIHEVLTEGDVVSSRIGQTREITNLVLHLTQPEYCLTGREHFSDGFMLEELTQILAGRYDKARLAYHTPRAAELITPATAYGPRVEKQLDYVEYELLLNPASRRAVVYVGRDDDLYLSDDIRGRAGEMPCTCVWQFQKRGIRLDMSVYMRSWDLVWGLGYDVPSFVGVQQALARATYTQLGTYTHHAGSGHIYDRHWALGAYERNDVLDLEGMGWLGDCIGTTRALARVRMSEPLPTKVTKPRA